MTPDALPLTADVWMLAGALVVDWLLGEYPAVLHPVVWIGKSVSLVLRCAPDRGWWRQLVFGGFLAVGVPALSAAAAWIVLSQTADFVWLQILLGIYLLKASFALCELGAAAGRVRDPVAMGDLEAARNALRSLCSRDPALLDEQGLLAATIQSLAENASDSFVAPLFYFALFGVPGALAYRAVNTLDAMVGYRGRFEALGKASARLDDVANWLPARLTALLLLVAGALSGCDVARAWQIFRRDRAKTPSPNGGRPMATIAGLLGVQLEKKGVYALGDPDSALTPTVVTRAWRLVVLTGVFAATACVAALWTWRWLPAEWPD
jgi:adenosylcobinamide-phosphate synthase